jgi:hypothetical protein
MYRGLVYNRVKELGFIPKTVIDVGACKGEWSSNTRSIFPESFIFGIDANDWNGDGVFPHCNISEVAVVTNIDDDDIIFYKKIEGFCTGDSIFRENTYHYNDNLLVQEKRKTKTLKTLCEKHQIDKIDLLKLDTQGSEILILDGLGSMLDNVDFVEIECALVEWNIGGAKIQDVIDYMREKFEIYEILEFHRLNNIDLIQVDILFKNKKSQIKVPL